VLITHRLFKSWQEDTALLPVLLYLPAPEAADDLSTIWILMAIAAWYLTIPMISEMTIQNPTTSLFGNHPETQRGSGYQMIPSCQHLENESQQLKYHLSRRDTSILCVGRSILSQRGRMKVSLHPWHPRSYPIMRLNDWICPLMYIFPRGWIQTHPVSKWLHGKFAICGDMSPVLAAWQASSSAQNTSPRLLFEAFRLWSWHVWSL